MSFNRFQAIRNPGNFPQFPIPGSGSCSWKPINNFGNIHHGLGNQNWNNTPDHLGQQRSCVMNTRTNFIGMGPQACYSRTTSPNYFGATPYPGPMPFYPQNMPSNFCCPYPTYNAPGCLVYPENQNQVAMIRTPDGQWLQPMNATVGPAYGLSTITTMIDFGTEFPPEHHIQQDQHGVTNYLTESSKQNREYLAIINGKPDEMQDPIYQSSSDLGEAVNQNANSEAGPSVQKWIEQWGEMKTDQAYQQDNKSTSGKKPMCCRLCRKNKERTEVYRSHNVTDGKGVTTCPYLRKRTCVCCKATGDKAHTLKFCPVNKRNQRMLAYRNQHL